tara:strand:- start:2363 stop:2494 length:132 start_codon:yes stop_codon:yes gene_type:complete
MARKPRRPRKARNVDHHVALLADHLAIKASRAAKRARKLEGRR